MLQAPQIRKLVLHAMEQHILPALQSPGMLQVRMAPPFELSNVEHWEAEQEYLPSIEIDPFQMVWSWKKEQMAASRFPYLIIMYEGIADHKMGFTQEMTAEIEKESGRVLPGALIARLPAPCVAYCAPFFPGHSSVDPSPAGYKSVCMSLMTENVNLHVTVSEKGNSFVSHSLQIHDPLLLQLGKSYIEELLITENDDVAQAQLYVFMNRLYRRLKAYRIPLANSAWPIPQTAQPAASTTDKELCQRSMEFIEMRLSGTLDRAIIAGAVGVSPDHLGRVFRNVMGLSVMNYVTQRRLEAAKMILAEGTENITEIAHLTGFASNAAFGVAFKRSCGVTPKEYRRKHHKRTKRKN